MKIDLWHAIYTIGMILLAFVAALVVTKTVSQWLLSENDKEGGEKSS